MLQIILLLFSSVITWGNTPPLSCASLSDAIFKEERKELNEARLNHSSIQSITNFEDSVLQSIQIDIKKVCDERSTLGKSLQEEFKPLTTAEAAHCDTLANRMALTERTISARASMVNNVDSFLNNLRLKRSGGLKQSQQILSQSAVSQSKKETIQKELMKVWLSPSGNETAILGIRSAKIALNERANDCTKMRSDATNAVSIISALVKTCGANDRGHFRGAINRSLALCNIPLLAIPGENTSTGKICQYNKSTGKKFDLSSYSGAQRISAYKKFLEDKKAGLYVNKPCP